MKDRNLIENIANTFHKFFSIIYYTNIFDFGILDVDYKELKPKDENVNFFGTTSDLTVYDLGANITKSEKIKYKVGNKISFKPNYMAVARLMSSKFIKKIIV